MAPCFRGTSLGTAQCMIAYFLYRNHHEQYLNSLCSPLLLLLPLLQGHHGSSVLDVSPCPPSPRVSARLGSTVFAKAQISSRSNTYTFDGSSVRLLCHPIPRVPAPAGFECFRRGLRSSCAGLFLRYSIPQLDQIKATFLLVRP